MLKMVQEVSSKIGSIILRGFQWVQECSNRFKKVQEGGKGSLRLVKKVEEAK